MSTFRYRDTAGGINGAYGTLTASTFTATSITIATANIVNLSVSGTINCFNINAAAVGATSLNVSGVSTQAQINCTGVATGILACTDLNCSGPGTFGGFEAVSVQGLHVQWNRAGQGESYIMNQKGGGPGAVNIGEVTSGNVFTYGLSVLATPAASAAVATQTGRIDVTGFSANTGLPAQGISLVTTTLGTKEMARCTAGGKVEYQIYEDVTNVAGFEYDATTNNMAYYNANGPSLYQGTNVGTIVRKPVQYLGGSVGNAFTIPATSTVSIRNLSVLAFDAGTKLTLTIPQKGHWMVNYRGCMVAGIVIGTAVVELWVAGVFFDNCQTEVIAGVTFLDQGASVLLDCDAATTLLEVKTSGVCTSGVSSEFYIWAVRVG